MRPTGDNSASVMSHFVRYLPYVGIASATIAAIAAAVVEDPSARQAWSLGFIAASILALWLLVIRLGGDVARIADTHADTTVSSEEMLASLLKNEPRISDRLLRQGFFGGSTVDDQFWLIYCQMLKSRYADQSDAELAREIVWSLSHQRIRVPEGEGYAGIKRFVEALFSRSMKYLAVVTDEDFDSLVRADANSPQRIFVLEFPLRRPDSYQRIFCLSDKKRLLDLNLDARRLLAQQIKAGVDVRFAPSGMIDNRNIAVYGDVAVGDYDEEKREESIIFNADIVSGIKSSYEVVLDLSTPLAIEDVLPEEVSEGS